MDSDHQDDAYERGTSSSRGRGGVVVAVIVALTLGIAGTLITLKLTNGTFDADGRVILGQRDAQSQEYGWSNYTVNSDGTCGGDFIYREMKAGATVEVYDSGDSWVARGTLSQGDFDGSTCTFTWKVPDIPAGQGPYTYKFKEQHIVMDFSEAEAKNTTLEYRSR